MTPPNRIVAVDFGTTNSALAVADGDGNDVRLATFLRSQAREPLYPSVLYFHPDIAEGGEPVPVTGPQGIEMYLDEDDGEGRMVQSIKSYLASSSFSTTSIFGRPWTLERMVTAIVGDLRAEAEAELGPVGDTLVVGRPVHFSRAQSEEDNERAVSRLRRAIGRAGFTNVTFAFEPIAAAYHYERKLERDETVLIADFGGGTSDFTLMEVGPSRRRDARRVLGTSGVPIAGNAFDYALVRAAIAPRLGLGTPYRTDMGKIREIPPPVYDDLAWHRLSLLHSDRKLRELEEIARHALVPERVEAFVHIVRYHLGYHLYRAVEAAKVALSHEDEAELRFVDDPIDIVLTVRRDQFEDAIAGLVSEIAGCVDRLLEDTSTNRADVDRVFLTGGSSFVPAVRRIFSDRFGDERLAMGDELTSVASGLVFCGR